MSDRSDSSEPPTADEHHPLTALDERQNAPLEHQRKRALNKLLALNRAKLEHESNAPLSPVTKKPELRAHEHSTSTERKRVDLAQVFASSTLPDQIGIYQIRGHLGSGKMGKVLDAFDPNLERSIAVKLFLHPRLVPYEAERLRREARALAKLSHPNVVQVYEVGTFEGQTFIAMEKIEGTTLKCWQSERPPWRACVEVYAQAAHGLAAAHAKGLVHRDFKPSNCMLDHEGRVHVVDFGLVRKYPTDTPPPEDIEQFDTVFTTNNESHHTDEASCQIAFSGSLSYISPEQHAGKTVDPRADQFSFCVSLYEALYGELPFPRQERARIEAGKHGWIREAPSITAVPRRVREIVLRGLAPQPSDRWSSMDVLRTRLEQAAAPSSHQRRLVALPLGLGLAGLGIGGAYYAEVQQRCTGAQTQLEGVWDEDRKRDVEDALRSESLPYATSSWERVEATLDVYASGWVDQYVEACRATAVRAERSEQDRDLRVSCLYRKRAELAALVDILSLPDARVVTESVKLASGLPDLRQCEDVNALARQRQRVPPPEDPVTVHAVERIRRRLADIKTEQRAGMQLEALQHIDAVTTETPSLGYTPIHAEALVLRGWLRQHAGRYSESEQDLVQAYTLATEHGDDTVAMRAAISATFVVGYRQQRYAEGQQWAVSARALAGFRDDRAGLASAISNEGLVLGSKGNLEQSASLLRQALEFRTQQWGEEHPQVAHSINNLANAYSRMRQWVHAEQAHRRALAIRTQMLGPDHPDVAQSLGNLGGALSHQGRHQEALEDHRQALTILEAAYGGHHAKVALHLVKLGETLEHAQDHAGAKAYYLRALRIWEEILPSGHPQVGTTLNHLGNIATALGDYEDAERYLRRVLRLWTESLGPDALPVALAETGLGSLFAAQGRDVEAEQHYRRGVEIQRATLPADHLDLVASAGGLGTLLYRLGRVEEATAEFYRVLEITERVSRLDHPTVPSAFTGLIDAVLSQGDRAAIRALAERGLAILDKTSSSSASRPDLEFGLARVLWPDEPARARTLATQALVRLPAGGDRDRKRAITAWLQQHRIP